MKQILTRIAQLKEELSRIELRAEKSHSQSVTAGATPDKTVHISQRRHCWQYYITSSHGKSTKYVPKNQLDSARAIIQRDYDARVLKSTRKWIAQLTRIEKILQSMPQELIADLHQPANLHPARRSLITPYCQTDDEYAQHWLMQPYVGKKIKNDDHYFLTNRGERVRSKSEKIIADALNASGIPYRYEAPLRLKRNRLIHPDFTVLIPSTRQQIYIEHFGMMGDPKYADDAVEKLKWYAEAGVTLGIDLFYLMETNNKPFPTEVLKRLIQSLSNADNQE